MKILCCGIFPALQRTLELKTLKCGSVNRAHTVHLSTGGKAVNAARVLTALGGNPLVFGFAGGETGKTIRTLLDNEQIRHEFTETRIPTRTAQTLLAENTPDFTEIIEDCPPLPANDWKQLVQEFRNLLKKNDAAIISGTLPAHAPPEIYREMLIHRGKKQILIDSPGKPLLEALETRPTLVKINAEEIRKTTGIQDPEEGSHELISVGAEAVGVTDGANPALLITPAGTVRFQIPVVPIKSSLGCGDSVNAGTIFALQHGHSLKEAFVFGLACGTANAMTDLPGKIDISKITELVPQISEL